MDAAAQDRLTPLLPFRWGCESHKVLPIGCANPETGPLAANNSARRSFSKAYTRPRLFRVAAHWRGLSLARHFLERVAIGGDCLFELRGLVDRIFSMGESGQRRLVSVPGLIDRACPRRPEGCGKQQARARTASGSTSDSASPTSSRVWTTDEQAGPVAGSAGSSSLAPQMPSEPPDRCRRAVQAPGPQARQPPRPRTGCHP